MRDPVDIGGALLVALASVGTGACVSGRNCPASPEPFEIDQPISAAELDVLVEDGHADDWDDLACETVCRETARVEAEGMVIDDCELMLPAGEEDAGRLSCSGTHKVVVGCGGRRPLGHVESEGREHGDALGWRLASMAYLEAASVTAFLQLERRLRAWGGPPRLLARCRDAAQDERNHARWMTRLARARGASVPKVRCERREPTVLEEATHNASESCVGETFAALLMLHRARHAHDPRARALFTRIAVDESRHAQLAWDLHRWFRGRLGPQPRRAIDAERAVALAELPRRAHRIARAEPGVSAVTAEALARALVREIDPELRPDREL